MDIFLIFLTNIIIRKYLGNIKFFSEKYLIV